MSGGDLEQECAEQLFKLGHKVILCDESKEFKPGEKASALDLKLDGKMMDIKSITGNGWYWRPLVKKNEQLYKYNLRPDVTTPAEALCLYFHKPSMFNEKICGIQSICLNIFMIIPDNMSYLSLNVYM